MSLSSLPLAKWFRITTVLILSILILSCSKTDKDKYAKVKTGMTLEQVVSILGEPTSTDQASISGLSGTSAVWKTAQSEIDIQFLNNRLSVKSYSKLDDEHLARS